MTDISTQPIFNGFDDQNAIDWAFYKYGSVTIGPCADDGKTCGIVAERAEAQFWTVYVRPSPDRCDEALASAFHDTTTERFAKMIANLIADRIESPFPRFKV